MTKCNLGKKGVYQIDHSASRREAKAGTRGRSLEARAETKTTEEFLMYTDLPCLACSAYLLTDVHLPKDVTFLVL